MNFSSAAAVALAVSCAYLNSIFLPNPRAALKGRDAKSIGVVIGVVVANALLWFVTKSDLLICLLVWFPAIAGIVAAYLLRDSKRS